MKNIITHLSTNFALSQAWQIRLRCRQMLPFRIQPQVGVEGEIVQNIVLDIQKVVAQIVVSVEFNNARSRV